MPFNRPSLQTIYDRMVNDIESKLTGNAPLLPVAFLRILAAVFAGAIHILYGWLTWLSEQLFYDTAEAESLDNFAIRWGVPRDAATFSTGTFTFEGVDGVEIPELTQLVTSDGIAFETTERGVISGLQANIAAKAIEAGGDGNIAQSTVAETVEPIANINSIFAASTFTGGEDEETDEQLRKKIQTRISTPPAGGTENDFEVWAREVEGVADAWAIGSYPSPGFVTVLIKADGPVVAPGAQLIQDTINYIETVMPVATRLVVDGVVGADLDFDLSITLQPGSDATEIQGIIESNLESYLLDFSAPGSDVLITGIQNAISTAGVIDYSINSINKDSVPQSTTSDIFMTFGELAVFNSVTFS